MRKALYRMSGVDLTSIDAIGVETVEVVLSEYVAPHRATSGGKPVRKQRWNTASTRVAAALRMAALSLRKS